MLEALGRMLKFSDGTERDPQAEPPFHQFLWGYSVRMLDARIDALRWENFRLREQLEAPARHTGESAHAAAAGAWGG
jgi:hypothetical protein